MGGGGLSRHLILTQRMAGDETCVRMRLSDAGLVLPLKIIFINCLNKGVFPEIWKYTNVVPVHKKNEGNVNENYRPVSLLQSSVIFSKSLYMTHYTLIWLLACQ